MVAVPAGAERVARFVSLDSLRGFAALVVVAYHLVDRAPFLASPFIANGLFGVGFFFVLSGFVIAHSYGDKLAQGFSAARYMLLRFGRVYPLHIAILATYLALEVARAVGVIPGMSDRAPFTGAHSWAKFMQAVFLLQPFQADPVTGYNWPAWSISIELVFYAIAAIFFRITARAWLLFLPLSLTAVFLVFRELYAPPLTLEVLRCAAGFGAGVTCYALWRAGWLALPGRALSSVLELLVIALVLVVVSRQGGGFDSYWQVIGTFALAILVFAHDGGVISAYVLHSRWARFLGRVSYSIYMVHSLVILLGFRLLLLADRAVGLGVVESRQVNGQAVEVIAGEAPLSWLLCAAVIAAVIVVAALTWRTIEEPARLWSRRRAAAFGAARAEAVAPTM